MISRLLHAVLLAALGTFCTQSAMAHATLEKTQAAVSASYKAVIRITHGCEGSPTLKVRVEIPEGVIGVKPMPKPGWTIAMTRGAYARAYNFYHGATLAEGVKEISWTGRLPDDFYDEFVFSSYLSDALTPGTALYFPTYQECEKGSYKWVEIPAPGQSSHALQSPAPGVVLVASGDSHHHMTQSYKLGALVIEAPWARATPGGAKVAGGYVKITNTGKEPDKLVGGTFESAAGFEIHEMSMSDGVMKMRGLTDGLEIKPGQTVELKPGGYHLMFTGLKSGLTQGQAVKGSLKFEKAGNVDVEFQVAPMGAASPDMQHHH